ncbi:hypothetical protein [Streptomyces subrutilus]|uniref:hypothetical protein n=1 Tax=Streptomyces subrutilus TaxID=36818 RepID=UPI002E157563|nr:hypothetical protein OG479_32955 [Streptomyces subrutilus]
MAIDISFIGDKDDYTYEDGEGVEYRYVINDNGTLAIFEKEEGGHLAGNAEPVAVYGPAAWFSVRGNARSKKDTPPARIRSF